MGDSHPGVRQPQDPGIADLGLLETLRERPAVPLSFVGQGGPQRLLGGPCLLVGGAIRNTGAARDDLNLFDGSDAGGIPAGAVGLIANGGAVWGPSDDGLFCRSGLSVTQTVGTISGALWVKF